MTEIESDDEREALQAAYAAWRADVDRKGDTRTTADAYRSAWLAGRDWQRARTEREVDESTKRLLNRQGSRLLGCNHYPSCSSAKVCAATIGG